jgi:mRNA interferase ChpB
MAGRHRFVVITSQRINVLGVSLTVPVASAGAFAREYGLGVVVAGHDTNGLAVCNQVRSFDLDQRIKEGSAKFIESLDKTTTNDIVSKVMSIIDLQD